MRVGNLEIGKFWTILKRFIILTLKHIDLENCYNLASEKIHHFYCLLVFVLLIKSINKLLFINSPAYSFGFKPQTRLFNGCHLLHMRIPQETSPSIAFLTTGYLCFIFFAGDLI